ncbi:NADPH:quinone reductase-like Zn-dependent oxidoreductase [Luteibacter sp. Sphag1AF]|uniref:zinc-dependent alcohol dehydrogenase family protein n=1 Tax=Luteibacter sp. Sphag1AF TaxID=2587031 RepID=UPI00161479CE|nr:NAD(P)-dependent alcohol dehydrogenase [Luteibacter sp. Sphag1AF]MBB3228237.1 NADPH:quinone reductase-like Zn-dependent oxidoreductase [Luteibacter sp. Sphag1AF]
MNTSMKCWEISAHGMENLALATAPRPQPKRGEILVKVDAVSLNFRDKEVMDHGMTAKLQFPFVPTSDMAGTVVEVGDDVTRFAVGDKVISTYITNWIDGVPGTWAQMPTQGGPIPGMLAEYVATPADWCVPAPSSLSPAQAATLPIAGLTAWMALVETGGLKAGETVLVQGTGGVALFAVQIAAAHGANVIVTSTSDEKINRAKALGARHGINRLIEPEWDVAVKALTGNRGADHILELAGGDLQRTLRAVKPGGRISIIGLLESEELSAPIMALLASRATLTAVAVGPRRALEDMVRMVELHAIKPVIDKVYAFDDAPAAFAHLVRGAVGKIVIDVSGHGS